MSARTYNKYKRYKRQADDKKSRLCCFGYVDYIVLASSLAVAISEEISNSDVNILATFFAVLSDELALIGAVRECSSENDNDEDDMFIPPVPDVSGVAATRSKKKVVKKKKIKKKSKK